MTEKKEESIFHNRQSCSYIIAPTETSHTEGKHPFCSNTLVRLFELRGMTVHRLQSSFLTWTRLLEHERLLILKKKKKTAVTKSSQWGEHTNAQLFHFNTTSNCTVKVLHHDWIWAHNLKHTSEIMPKFWTVTNHDRLNTTGPKSHQSIRLPFAGEWLWLKHCRY